MRLQKQHSLVPTGTQLHISLCVGLLRQNNNVSEAWFELRDDFWTQMKERGSNVTSCETSHLQERSWHAQVECTEENLRQTNTCTQPQMHTPDTSHASGLRAKLASLQLTGNDLSFGFQLPGQTFELQLLERRDRGNVVYLLTITFVVTLSITSAPSSLSHFFLIGVKWTLR